MTIEKEKGGSILIALIILSIIMFIHGYIVFRGGFANEALKLHIYVLPVSALLSLFAVGIIRSLGKKIIILKEGLLVEEFSPVPIPWSAIQLASIKKQFLPRGGECHWLVLQTINNSDYLSPRIQKLNRLIGINGVPVCNLSNYAGDTNANLNVIQQRIANA